MRIIHCTIWAGLALATLLLASCDSSSGSGAQKVTSGDTTAVLAADRRADGGDATEGITEKELSDLDRPLEELFSAVCEHGKKMFECDECRYETGVVKAPRDLFDEDLLRTEQVSSEQVEIPLWLTGEIRFDERRVAQVNTRTEGVIRGVYVVLGDKVKKGQALMEIESVEIGEAEAAYLEAEALLRLARTSHERESELHRKGFLSEREYLQSKQDFETAEIRARSALGKLTRLGMAAADADTLSQATAKGRVVLAAPLDGTVLSLHAVPGELATMGEPLATVGNNATVWVWADLYERDLSLVMRMQPQRKLPAAVTVKAYPSEEFAGSVDFVSPVLEEASRTVRLRVEVENTDSRLLAGMFASVRLLLPGNDEALAVSKNAVLEDEGRSFVFVHHHGEYYVRRPVAPGRSWGNRIEVVSGLRRGETIVADGSFLLKSDVLRSKMGAGCAD